MAPLLIFPRDDSETSSALGGSSNVPIIAAGFTVVGVIVLGLTAYFVLRYFRNRNKKQREEKRGAAFLNVRGVVEDKEDREPLPSALLGIHGETFSRNNLTAGVVMPSKTIRSDASREEIYDFYTAQGKMPKPFRPFSFALNAPQLVPPSPTFDGSSGRRSSVGSFLSVARNSFMSVGSKRLSTASTVSSFNEGAKRKVRQTFDPVLPDELVISLGEQLTVVQSHDDGWCVVGRSSVFKPDEVELGAVPAWIFIKPTKGLRAERPMRVSSLGVSVQLDAGPSFSSREEVISWSNF